MLTLRSCDHCIYPRAPLSYLTGTHILPVGSWHDALKLIFCLDVRWSLLVVRLTSSSQFSRNGRYSTSPANPHLSQPPLCSSLRKRFCTAAALKLQNVRAQCLCDLSLPSTCTFVLPISSLVAFEPHTILFCGMGVCYTRVSTITSGLAQTRLPQLQFSHLRIW